MVTLWASADYVPDDAGSVAVVLGVVGRIDVALDGFVRPGEADIGFGPAGADAAGPAGEGVPVPRAVRSAG